MRASLATLLLLAAASAVPAAAQNRLPSPPPDALGGHVRLSAILFENFFQTPDGEPEENVPAAGLEAGLHKGFGRDLTLFGDVNYTSYRRYRPSGGVAVGVRRESRPHAFDVQAQLQKGRPSREVRDEFDRADTLGLVGQYGYRFGDWEPLALAELRHETYDLAPEKANDVVNVGFGVRYRGLGRVSPEVGFRFGSRDVKEDNEDLSQRELYVRVRWAPARPTYVTLRLRRRYRDYSIEDPGAANFSREDTRTQAVASADFLQTSRLGFNVYYSIEDSDSTHPRGEFVTQMLAAGVVLRF